MEADLIHWSNDSVGIFQRSYTDMRKYYKRIASVKELKDQSGIMKDRYGGSEEDFELAKTILKGMRNCMRIFAPPKGNRTCFQICD